MSSEESSARARQDGTDTKTTMATPTLSRSAKRILIVDHDEALLRDARDWLLEAGHEVVCASHFGAARNCLASSVPHVLITEVRLGAYNGLQLVILAKLEHPEIMAIVMTRFDDPVLRKEAWKAGADFLLKPISPGQLLDRLI